MTSLRVFLPLILAACVAGSSFAQSKRDNGPSRTEKKVTAKTPARDDGRGPDRRPQGKYDPLPHDPPITRPVDVNYPPVIYVPVSAPPELYPVYIDNPAPRPGHPQRPAPDRRRKIVQARLDDCMERPESAGYSFARELVVSCEDSTVDLYLSTTGPDTAYFLVPQDNDIRDYGPRESLRDVVRFRPGDWAEDHAALLVPGHVYVVWTYDGDFFLVRVLELGERYAAFEWVRHSHLSRATAAEAEKRQKEKDADEAKRRESLGPYFPK